MWQFGQKHNTGTAMENVREKRREGGKEEGRGEGETAMREQIEEQASTGGGWSWRGGEGRERDEEEPPALLHPFIPSESAVVPTACDQAFPVPRKTALHLMLAIFKHPT